MSSHLYAFKEDLDMLTQDVSLLKNNYRSIDRIAKRFDDLWHEQTMQAEQMRRMEENIKRMQSHIRQMQDDIKQMQNDIKQMQNDIKSMHQRLDGVEKLLLLICQKLGINPASV